MIGIPLLVSFEKKPHDHLSMCDETMGEAGGRAGHRLQNDRTGDAATGEK
jgi:hypothetical protein